MSLAQGKLLDIARTFFRNVKVKEIDVLDELLLSRVGTTPVQRVFWLLLDPKPFLKHVGMAWVWYRTLRHLVQFIKLMFILVLKLMFL